MKLLVTGASGLVGSHVVSAALNQNMTVVGQTHRQSVEYIDCYQCDISALTDWSQALQGVDCVVHCAARVHQMTDDSLSPLDAYREVNTEGTLNLARQSIAAGVKRFVFISSVKVNGEFSERGQPFINLSEQVPSDPYGLSKFEAEQGLWQLAKETGLEVVVIRPPLVYGPDVKANFLSMMNWIKKGIPLPLGAIHNTRSLVFVDNLADLILTCCIHSNANGETFLVSDDCDVSTSQLLREVAKSMAVSYRMLPVPMSWITFAAGLMGKPGIAQRLCGNLQVDITHTKQTLGWIPPYTFEYGVKRTVERFLRSK